MIFSSLKWENKNCENLLPVAKVISLTRNTKCDLSHLISSKLCRIWRSFPQLAGCGLGCCLGCCLDCQGHAFLVLRLAGPAGPAPPSSIVRGRPGRPPSRARNNWQTLQTSRAGAPRHKPSKFDTGRGEGGAATPRHAPCSYLLFPALSRSAPPGACSRAGWGVSLEPRASVLSAVCSVSIPCLRSAKSDLSRGSSHCQAIWAICQ